MLRTVLLTILLAASIQAPAPAPAPQTTDPDRATMIALLERIQKLANDALGTESKAGKVSVDRAALNEIIADAAQVKASLQK